VALHVHRLASASGAHQQQRVARLQAQVQEEGVPGGRAAGGERWPLTQAMWSKYQTKMEQQAQVL
jgi:hypothetical protein